MVLLSLLEAADSKNFKDAIPSASRHCGIWKNLKSSPQDKKQTNLKEKHIRITSSEVHSLMDKVVEEVV